MLDISVLSNEEVTEILASLETFRANDPNKLSVPLNFKGLKKVDSLLQYETRNSLYVKRSKRHLNLRRIKSCDSLDSFENRFQDINSIPPTEKTKNNSETSSLEGCLNSSVNTQESVLLNSSFGLSQDERSPQRSSSGSRYQSQKKQKQERKSSFNIPSVVFCETLSKKNSLPESVLGLKYSRNLRSNEAPCTCPPQRSPLKRQAGREMSCDQLLKEMSCDQLLNTSMTADNLPPKVCF